jgi:hypothetical protein
MTDKSRKLRFALQAEDLATVRQLREAVSTLLIYFVRFTPGAPIIAHMTCIFRPVFLNSINP